MISFEEELKKFNLSLEVEELEPALHALDLTDAADMLVGMMKEVESEQNGQY